MTNARTAAVGRKLALLLISGKGINARLALLFALGHQKSIYDEEYFPANQSMEELQTIFELWQDQPAAKDIPPHPVLVDGQARAARGGYSPGLRTANILGHDPFGTTSARHRLNRRRGRSSRVAACAS
jgi:hypothetical protein